MSVVQNLTLDVNNVSMFDYINTKQGDDGRYLYIRITVDGAPVDVPAGSTVAFRAVKPDNTIIYDAGSVLTDGRVAVRLSQNALAVPGRIMADISVISGGKMVSTVTFVILNREYLGDASAITSTSSFTALSSLVTGLSNYDSSLTALNNNKATGPGITVDLIDGIMYVTEVSS